MQFNTLNFILLRTYVLMQDSFHFWKKALPSEVASEVESYLEVNTWVDC